jgi:hypothetical protein
MAGGDKGNVFRAYILQLFKNIGKLIRSDSFSSFCTGNFVILTKDATQIAPRKEDGTASVFKGNAGFFKGVKVKFCHA